MSVETKSRAKFIEGLDQINVTEGFSFTQRKSSISASHEKLKQFVNHLISYGFHTIEDENEYSDLLKEYFSDEQLEILKILINKMIYYKKVHNAEFFSYELDDDEHNKVIELFPLKEMYSRGGGKRKSKTYKRKLRNISTNHKSRKYKRKN